MGKSAKFCLFFSLLHHDIIRLHEVTVRYGQRLALNGVTANIHCGKLVALLGPNGAGKSTLLRAILGWLPLAGGEIRIGDSHVQHALPRLAYLPQRAEIDWDFPITVRAVVAQGRWPALGLFRRFTAEDKRLVDRALEELGIANLADQQIRRLSVGQQQRMFLARALAQGADIFLLDEPFSGLDLHASEELVHILRHWQSQGRTVLAALHDLPLAQAHFSHALLLNTQLVGFGLIGTVLSPENINRAFRQEHCVHQGVEE